jgi:tetratricopeptide (TPR) repeat protein
MRKSVFGALLLVPALASVLLVPALTVRASAQLVAGSAEDGLFREITAAGDPARKIALGRQFEEQFPNAPSPVLASVWTIIMNSHEQRQEAREAVAYGEKIIASDPENVNAYMALCRLLSVNLRDDLDQAVEYGERAVQLAQALKGRQPPGNYTAEQWTAYADQTETYARSILSYARTIRAN